MPGSVASLFQFLQQQASLAIMRKVMDRAQRNADFINKAMGETNMKAAQPNLGGKVDIKGSIIYLLFLSKEHTLRASRQ